MWEDVKPRSSGEKEVSEWRDLQASSAMQMASGPPCQPRPKSPSIVVAAELFTRGLP
jgi:hypothetical protein